MALIESTSVAVNDVKRPSQFGQERGAIPCLRYRLRDTNRYSPYAAFGEEILDVRSESGYFTYISTAMRITSGELLKYLNGLRIRRR